MLSENLKKTVLVTGAAGFIGSHLCEHLVGLGFKVRAFVRYNSKNSWGWLDQSPFLSDIEVISGDLRDYDSVFNAMRGVDGVFHLGALIGIPYSYESPLAYIKTNVEGTYNILESGRRHETRRMILMSTSEVYGTALRTPIDELHPLQPQSPYSASKISADNMGLSYFNSFNSPVVIARPFNTYGPRQSARAIIPTILSQLLSGEKEIKIGSINPVRDLTFVGDTVSALGALFNAPKVEGKTFNICSGSAISVGDLCEKIFQLTGKRAEIKQDQMRVRPSSSEVMVLLGDPSAIKKTTGWLASYSLDEGLVKTAEWIDQNIGKFKPEIYNV